MYLSRESRKRRAIRCYIVSFVFVSLSSLWQTLYPTSEKSNESTDAEIHNPATLFVPKGYSISVIVEILTTLIVVQ